MPTVAFHAELPTRWQPLVGPDVVVAARAAVTEERQGVRPNLLLARDRIPGEVALAAVAALATAGHATIATGDVEIDGLERCVRVVTSTSAQGTVDIAQVFAFVAPVRVETGWREIAQFVGTCALDDLGRHGPTFAAVIESIVEQAGLREPAVDVVD